MPNGLRKIWQKRGLSALPRVKNYAGTVAWRRILKRLSYTKNHGIDGDGLIPGKMLYSNFFILCSINKKKENFYIYRDI
jgi:hypothetical protein